MMPDDPFKYEEYYQRKIKPYLDRPLGLLILFLLLFVGTVLVLQGVQALKETLNFLIITPILFLIAIIIWLGLRRFPKFNEDETGVLVALFLVNAEADKELTLLYRKLENILNRESLGTKVVLKFLPPRLIPKDAEDAHKIREKAQAKLIIWGDVDSGTIESEKQTVFRPVYFSYGMNLPKDRLEIFNRNLSAILQKRKWIISERNSVIEREYLANNLEEICFYILGTVLFLSGKNHDSLELLKPVLKKYRAKIDLSNDDKIAIYNISSVIGFIYSVRIKSLALWPTSNHKERDLKEADVLLNELKELKFLGPYYLLMSISKFYKNDISGAIESAELSGTNSDPEDPAPNFSLAFLYFYKKDLVNGFRKLQKAIKARKLLEMGDQGVSIIRWYEDIIADRKYLNYALGVLYYELSGDMILARECLSLFLNDFKNNKDKIIVQMRYEAEKRLKKLDTGFN